MKKNLYTKLLNINQKKIIFSFGFIKISNQTNLSLLILLLFFILIFNFCYTKLHFKLKIQYYYNKRLSFLIRNNRTYNESNLITFEDKLNWLIIHDTNQLKGKCADKIILHKFSKRILKKDICNKILKIYDNFQQINFRNLPDQFVLKTNHGSGFNIIVTNKSEFDYNSAFQKVQSWMKIDYGKFGEEFHYSFIKRKIFIEEFIGDKLKNYKFLCYNGNPKYVYLSIKEGNNKYRNFYDMNWRFLNFHCLSEPNQSYEYPKPKLFELMKLYSKKLSKNFKFVRVDLYEYNNEVRLGELTFYPMNGFFFCKNKSDEIELAKDIIIN